MTQLPTPEAAEKPAQSAGGSNTISAHNVWDLLISLVAMATLVVIVVVVVDHYESAKAAATVLGLIVPGLVSLGAAFFGVSVAYQAGSKQGEAKGKAAGKRDAGKLLQPHVRKLKEHTRPNILEALRSAGSSRAGTSYITFSEPSDVQIEASALDDAHAAIAGLDGAVDALLSETA
jgi:hypothetical protein